MEIAAIIGQTKRTVNRRAQRESWEYTEDKARGGTKRLYIGASLPLDVRQAVEAHMATQAMHSLTDANDLPVIPSMEEELAKERAAIEARRARKEQGLVKWAGMDETQKNRANARAWILRAWAHTRERLQCTRDAAVKVLIAEYQSGALAVPEQYTDALPRLDKPRAIDRATLYRWDTLLREHGISALVPSYGNRKGSGVIAQDKALNAIVVGAMMKYPHITGKKAREYIAAKRDQGAQVPYPSARTIDRYLAGWKRENAQLWTYLTNPDQWKNVFLAAHGSHTERVKRLNQVWEMDSTPGDWLLQDGRHTVIGVIDLYSRRLMLLVSKTSRSVAVCQVYRRAVLAWGSPETVRTDNGKDYVAEQFTGLLRDMEIRQELCIPFASEQKGTIERALGTMSHGILDLLPGFIGHSVSDRKVIEARKSFASRVMDRDGVVEVALSSGQLQEILDRWVSAVYERDSHSGDGMKGRSPFEVAAAWTGPLRRVQDERALDALLAELAGTRIIQKKGIRHDHHWFIHPDLPEYTGQEAALRLDEHDLGRLYVYVDSRFVCRAECPDLVGIDRKEWAAVAKAQQKRKLAEQSQEYRQYKRDLKDDIPAVVMEHRMDQADNVVALQPKGEGYTTAAMDSAGEAARLDDAVPMDQGGEDDAMMAEFQREFAQTAAVVEMDDDPMTRFGHWLSIDVRIEAGGLVAEGDREWHRMYRSTPEWRASKGIYDDFGLAVDAAGA